MSDPTTLYEKCEHGHINAHDEGGKVYKRCPGGRERTFFKTTMLSVVAEPGYFDGMDIWVSERVEVTDEPQMGS